MTPRAHDANTDVSSSQSDSRVSDDRFGANPGAREDGDSSTTSLGKAGSRARKTASSTVTFDPVSEMNTDLTASDRCGGANEESFHRTNSSQTGSTLRRSGENAEAAGSAGSSGQETAASTGSARSGHGSLHSPLTNGDVGNARTRSSTVSTPELQQPARAPDLIPGKDEVSKRLGLNMHRTDSAEFLAFCKEQPLKTRGRLEQWELVRPQVHIGKRLGHGDGGVIHLAKWRGLTCVAKMLHQSGSAPRGISAEVARQDLANEISLISHLRHPALVLFLGACTKTEPVIILSEFMAGGNLEDYIARAWQMNQQWNPPQEKVLKWILDIARALSFLHNCVTPIIHRDLKPSNLLLDQHGHIKVCDFGLSRVRQLHSNGAYRMTGKTGSLRYMAPEVFTDCPTYDEKVDLYSLAMIMWYIITGTRPFNDISARHVAIMAAKHQHRPPLEPVAAKHSWPMAALVRRCWAADPANRPSALDLVKDLDLVSRYRAFDEQDARALPRAVALEARALFHQAVAGQCEAHQPPLWQLSARREWRAWRDLGDMGRGVALDKLNLMLDDVSPRWRRRSNMSIGAPHPNHEARDPTVQAGRRPMPSSAEERDPLPADTAALCDTTASAHSGVVNDSSQAARPQARSSTEGAEESAAAENMCESSERAEGRLTLAAGDAHGLPALVAGTWWGRSVGVVSRWMVSRSYPQTPRRDAGELLGADHTAPDHPASPQSSSGRGSLREESDDVGDDDSDNDSRGELPLRPGEYRA